MVSGAKDWLWNRYRAICNAVFGIDNAEAGNVILTEPAGCFDSIHLIKYAVAVVTDSGGILQEAHYAQTPYVFVLDIPKAPKNTRFDVSRLVKPERKEILRKLEQPQSFVNTDKSTFKDNVNLKEHCSNIENRVL